MSPTVDRVQALMEAEPPKSSHEVCSFLGMANFSAPFIPSFSTITAPLRELTKKNATFEWNDPQVQAFNGLKHALSADTVMAYFAPARETKVIVDGSKKDGVASILTQKDPQTEQYRVVRYDSRATTPPEKNYAPIEVESLAILFALEKNYLYLHGMKHFLVSTDHKPLVNLYTQFRKEMPLRVQKHKLALQGKFNFSLIWEAGKDNPADYNSRHPATSPQEDSAKETEIAVSAVICEAIPDAIQVQDVAAATDADQTLQQLKLAVQKGHLDVHAQPALKEYARFFDALSIIEGVLCREDKVLIPAALQRQVVEIVHEAHQGITKTKQYVRATMWFPKIEERLSGCHLCQAVTDSHHKEPILLTEMPQEPWSTLCTDIFGPLPTGEYLVLVQDLHSRFPEVAITNSTSAAAVIPAIDKILAAFGTPEVVGSDNGPPFNSHEFTQFAKKLGFRHRTITPRSLGEWDGRKIHEEFGESDTNSACESQELEA
jgi:hypothetical protein